MGQLNIKTLVLSSYNLATINSKTLKASRLFLLLTQHRIVSTDLAYWVPLKRLDLFCRLEVKYYFAVNIQTIFWLLCAKYFSWRFVWNNFHWHMLPSTQTTDLSKWVKLKISDPYKRQDSYSQSRCTDVQRTLFTTWVWYKP